MSLGEIFLVVFLAVLSAAFILKFGRRIIDIILAVIFLVVALGALAFGIVFDLIFWPIRMIFRLFGLYSEEELQRITVGEYDKIFLTARSKKEVARHMKKINRMQQIRRDKAIRKEEAKTKKLLEECKWVL